MAILPASNISNCSFYASDKYVNYRMLHKVYMRRTNNFGSWQLDNNMKASGYYLFIGITSKNFRQLNK